MIYHLIDIKALPAPILGRHKRSPYEEELESYVKICGLENGFLNNIFQFQPEAENQLK